MKIKGLKAEVVPCRKNARHTLILHSPERDNPLMRKWWVWCHRCGRNGPHRDTPEDAVEAWNAMEREHHTVLKCCICGREMEGPGNDPRPLRAEGRCCPSCNWDVIFARLEAAKAEGITTDKKEAR